VNEHKVNIIHGGRSERLQPLYKELKEQGIEDFEIWNGVEDSRSVVRAINLSHKQIIQDAKDIGLESVIVAEDDVKFYDKGAFDYFLSQTPENYDLFLGGIYVGEIKNDVVKDFCGFHLYRVHRLFFDEFLSVDVNTHIDRGLANRGLYKVCNPFVAYQSDGFSSNSCKEEIYGHLMQGRLIYKAS
jgi:hypothetical protein